MAETTRQRKFREFNKRQDERDNQKELKDRYDTGITDEDIAVAKQKAAEMANMMKQPAGQGTMGPMQGMKKGGKVKAATMTFETYTKTGKKAGLKTVPVKKMASGGKVSQLAKANGIAVRGKSRGKIC